MWTGREADHSPLSSNEAGNGWSLHPLPHSPSCGACLHLYCVLSRRPSVPGWPRGSCLGGHVALSHALPVALLVCLSFRSVGISQCSVAVNFVVCLYRGTSIRTGILATIVKVPRDWGSIPRRCNLQAVCRTPNNIQRFAAHPTTYSGVPHT